MDFLCFDSSKAEPFLGKHEIGNLQEQVKTAHHMLHSGSGAGNDYLGWLEWPVRFDREEYARLKQCVQKNQK